jgi:hypothetical protein
LSLQAQSKPEKLMGTENSTSLQASTSESTKEIEKAVGLAMSLVSYVQKTQPKSGKEYGAINYSYMSEAEIVKKLHGAFVECGLSIRPVAFEFLVNEVFLTNSNKNSRRTVLLVKYRFSHVSGEWFEVISLGEANDTGDKSIAKAMTIAYKYALRQTFMIETGDDPDADQGPENDVAQPQRGNSQSAGRQSANQPNQPQGRQQTQNDKPENKQEPKKEDKPATVPDAKTRFDARMKAIPLSKSIENLNGWRKGYSEDAAMSDEQRATLEKAYWARHQELKPKEDNDFPEDQGEMFENQDADPVDQATAKH